MNLRDLHYIVAVADTGNFNKAAHLCHISQPTLSMQIKKLEGYLGLPLFERDKKRVLVTAAGEKIIAHARHIMDSERAIRTIARLEQNPLEGEFKLGAIPTLASYLFPTLLPRVTKSLPKLKMLLVEEKTTTLVEQLSAGILDAAFLALPIEDDRLVGIPLFSDPFLLAVNSAHKLAKKKAVTIDDLTGQKLLLLDDGHCLRDQVLSFCATRPNIAEQDFRATSLETLRLMVRSRDSDFVTLIPQIAQQSEDGLTYIPFTNPKPTRTIGLVWRKTSARGKVMDALVEIAKA